MRLIAPAERCVQHARHLAIIGIGAEPGQKPRILGALDARADDFRPGVDFGVSFIGVGTFAQRRPLRSVMAAKNFCAARLDALDLGQ